MFAFLKRRQLGFALLLLLALSLSLLISFTLGRNRKAYDRTPLTRANNTQAKVEAHSPSHDSDNDGLPHRAQLESYMDRENFRSWFTLIAEGQFYQINKDWNAERRVCAGLVRFAWREALRRHCRPWFQKMGPAYKAIAPDVKRYQLEQGPLGEKLFRTNF